MSLGTRPCLVHLKRAWNHVRGNLIQPKAEPLSHLTGFSASCLCLRAATSGCRQIDDRAHTNGCQVHFTVFATRLKPLGFIAFFLFFRCSVCSRSTERLIQQPADSGSQCSSHYSQFSSDSDGQSRLVCMLFVSRQSRNCQCQCSSFGSSCLKQVKDDFQPVSFASSRFVLCLFFLGLIQLDPSNSDRPICQTNRSSLPLI